MRQGRGSGRGTISAPREPLPRASMLDLRKIGDVVLPVGSAVVTLGDLAMLDALGEVRLAAAGQDARLADPILALDSTGEGEVAPDPKHVFMRPLCDLGEMPDAERMQAAFVLVTDALDPLEI